MNQTQRVPESQRIADDLESRLEVLDNAVEMHVDRQNKEFFALRDNVQIA